MDTRGSVHSPDKWEEAQRWVKSGSTGSWRRGCERTSLILSQLLTCAVITEVREDRGKVASRTESFLKFGSEKSCGSKCSNMFGSANVVVTGATSGAPVGYAPTS